MLDLCKVCRVARQAELEAQGKSIHGKTRPRESILRSAISDVVGPEEPELALGLTRTRAHLYTEQIIADAETGGQGGLTPAERFDVLKMSVERGGIKNGRAYMDMIEGKIEVDDANFIPFDMRQEIRDAVRAAVATVPEIRATYAISERALDQIMAEPDTRPPEEEPVQQVAEDKPANQRAEHMARMREARAQKKAEREAELERLRAAQEQLAARNGDYVLSVVEFPQISLPSEGPEWTVTVMRPTDVTVTAPTLAAALARVQEELVVGPEAILGIVRK